MSFFELLMEGAVVKGDNNVQVEVNINEFMLGGSSVSCSFELSYYSLVSGEILRGADTWIMSMEGACVMGPHSNLLHGSLPIMSSTCIIQQKPQAHLSSSRGVFKHGTVMKLIIAM